MTIEKSVLNVEGMSCNHCVNSIQKAVGALSGVISVDVSLAEKSVAVEYDADEVDLVDIIEIIEEQGYEIAEA